MKFKVQFKDPDALDIGVDQYETSVTIEGLTAHERELVRESRLDECKEFASGFLEYGEYVTIEFDTEARTAVVLPVRAGL